MPEPKTSRIDVAVTDRDRARIEAEARRRDVPLSQIVREMIRTHLARAEEPAQGATA